MPSNSEMNQFEKSNEKERRLSPFFEQRTKEPLHLSNIIFVPLLCSSVAKSLHRLIWMFRISVLKKEMNSQAKPSYMIYFMRIIISGVKFNLVQVKYASFLNMYAPNHAVAAGGGVCLWPTAIVFRCQKLETRRKGTILVIPSNIL